VEVHQKRHRGPKGLWPLERLIIKTTRHLPHWAQPVYEAIDRAVFETTIVDLEDDPPPPPGVREPRRPLPTAPSASRARPIIGSDEDR
jgi:hypothetical protein